MLNKILSILNEEIVPAEGCTEPIALAYAGSVLRKILGNTPEVINVLGLKIQLVGFQGGIIIALMMGAVVAYLDKFFEKKVPSNFKLLISPMLTVFISALLMFTIVGPIGRGLASGLTTVLVWVTTNLGG